jgi:hypothetical protein
MVLHATVFDFLCDFAALREALFSFDPVRRTR